MKTIIKTIVPSSRIGVCPHSIKSKFGKLILGIRFYYLYYLSFASSTCEVFLLLITYYLLLFKFRKFQLAKLKGFRLLYQKDDPPDEYHSRSGLVVFDN